MRVIGTLGSACTNTGTGNICSLTGSSGKQHRKVTRERTLAPEPKAFGWKRETQETKSSLTVGKGTDMADQCLPGVIEATGALSAIGFPVLLLGVSAGLAYGAHGERGLSLLWSGLQSVGVFRGGLAVTALPAVGCVAAVAVVRISGVNGVSAVAVAGVTGATVSAIMSAVVAAETARSIRAKQEAEAESLIYTVGCGVLLGMGMSFILGRRNRNGGGTNRSSEGEEEEDEDHEMNAEDKHNRRRKRKKRRNKKKINSVSDLKNIF